MNATTATLSGRARFVLSSLVLGFLCLLLVGGVAHAQSSTTTVNLTQVTPPDFPLPIDFEFANGTQPRIYQSSGEYSFDANMGQLQSVTIHGVTVIANGPSVPIKFPSGITYSTTVTITDSKGNTIVITFD